MHKSYFRETFRVLDDGMEQVFMGGNQHIIPIDQALEDAIAKEGHRALDHPLLQKFRQR